jgi:hypothetical protein
LGTEVVVTASGAAGGAAILKDSVAVAVWVGEAVSVTFTPILDVPAVVGVPDRTPLEFNVRPAGSEVVAAHVYGLVPPLALSVVE